VAAFEIRKTHIGVEETWHERGPRREKPLRIAVGAAVIRNPFAGRHEKDLLPFMAELRQLGTLLAKAMIERLGADTVEAYGKGAIVGEDGELEHGALWHEAGGWAMRAELGQPKAIVPAAKTVGTLGTRLMIPLGHIQAAYVRSHFGTAELTIWDAPRRDEILYGLAMATGGRVHQRSGGLQVDDIKVNDGQR
jgi:Amino acid synthesis